MEEEPEEEVLLKIEEKSSSKSEEARSAGNVFLKKKKHNNTIIKEAYFCFSKSAAYALPDSEELALAYNNRSILSQHIKKYHFALVDIDEALRITASPVLKIKLLIRQISSIIGRKKI